MHSIWLQQRVLRTPDFSPGPNTEVVLDVSVDSLFVDVFGPKRRTWGSMLCLLLDKYIADIEGMGTHHTGDVYPMRPDRCSLTVLAKLSQREHLALPWR